jgi:hypothetical protein
MVASWFVTMNLFAHALPFLDDPCFLSAVVPQIGWRPVIENVELAR